MDTYLSDNQIEYVIFHLNMIFDVSPEIRSKFSFLKFENNSDKKQRIFFPLSEKEINFDIIAKESEVPVLFPILNDSDSYHIEDGSLFFHHDFLKSSFYLLSGYQELNPDHLDSMGRFPYSLSIQSKLGITGKPIVNYYFQIIAKGVEAFCKANDIRFEWLNSFDNFCFFLTHDVDKVDTFTIYEVIYKFKQALGLAKPSFSFWKSIGIALNYLFNYCNVFNPKNPQWDFPFLREVESQLKFRSAFYFLPKDQLHHDAYYSFKEKRIKKLFDFIDNEKCEIGLHGTVNSSNSVEEMRKIFALIEDHSPQAINGIRQHRLLYEIEKTPLIFDQIGFMYDTSLGFAEHVGFRNSFCLPFRLYDHKGDKMLSTWEIPLIAMDASLFYYQNYTVEQAMIAIQSLLDEIMLFNGVFTLLWHNGFFDEQLYPEIKSFYTELLALIKKKNPENMLGRDIIERMEEITKINNEI